MAVLGGFSKPKLISRKILKIPHCGLFRLGALYACTSNWRIYGVPSSPDELTTNNAQIITFKDLNLYPSITCLLNTDSLGFPFDMLENDDEKIEIAAAVVVKDELDYMEDEEGTRGRPTLWK